VKRLLDFKSKLTSVVVKPSRSVVEAITEIAGIAMGLVGVGLLSVPASLILGSVLVVLAVERNSKN